MEKDLEKSNSSQNKKLYVAFIDQQGVRKGFWPSGETRMLTDEQAAPKLKRGIIMKTERKVKRLWKEK
jgi:hypothetical protein